jgi:hypothetical protein
MIFDEFTEPNLEKTSDKDSLVVVNGRLPT